MIVVYTKDHCPQCTMTKRYLTKHNLPFTERSAVEYSEELRELGFTAVPVITTPYHAWSGFQPNKLKQLTNQST